MHDIKHTIFMSIRNTFLIAKYCFETINLNLLLTILIIFNLFIYFFPLFLGFPNDSFLQIYHYHNVRTPNTKKRPRSLYMLCLSNYTTRKHSIHEQQLQQKHVARSMRSNHSTWDPRRPLYEELKAPPVPRRQYQNGGSGECYHPGHPGIRIRVYRFFFIIYSFIYIYSI